MSDDKCKCTLRESMLGDGCRVCQPRTYIAHLEDALKLAEGEIAQLEAELADARKPISDEQIENIIFQCDGFLKWGVGDHGKQMIREKIRAIIKEQGK